MEIAGLILPLWAVFLIALIVVIIAWKFIKFALKLLIILVVFFIILMGLDYFQVFDKIQGIITVIFNYPLY